MIDNILDKLYKISKTPRDTKITYSEDIIADILTTDETAGEDVEISKRVVLFLLRLIDTPEDLTGAAHAGYFIRLLLLPFLDEAKVEEKDRDDFLHIVDYWFACLENMPVKEKYYREVDGTESQLFRFHLEASDAKLPRRYSDKATRSTSKSPSPLYAWYATYLHLKIRDLIDKAYLMKKEPDQFIYEHVCSARMFFNFMHYSYKYGITHPKRIPEEYINSFVEEYDRRVYDRVSSAVKVKGGSSTYLSTRASDYRSMFCDLIDNDYIPRSEEKKPPVHVDYYVDDYVSEDSVDAYSADRDEHLYSKGRGNEVETLKTETYFVQPLEEEDIALTGMESPQEREFLREKGGREIVERKPNIKKRWADFVDFRKFYFFWDSSFLNLYHYSKLYEIIEQIFDPRQQSETNTICVFLMVCIHTGIRPDYLIKTLIQKDIKENTLPVIVKKDKYYHLNIDLPFIRNKPLPNQKCMPTLQQVNVPIAYFLQKHIENSYGSSKKYLFSYMKDEAEVHIDLFQIDEFLKGHVNDKLNLRITATRIANSFFPLYSSRYGMDPIVACYVSKNHYRIFNAQLHYIFLPQEYFFEEYRETSKKVHDGILENIRMMRENGFIRTTLNPRRSVIPKRKGVGEERGYGSPQIPTNLAWSTFIFNLKNKIRSYNNDQLYRRHNLYSIYLYFLLMFSTFLRPRNNPDIRWDDYNDELEIMIISDKLSPTYYEERVVPIVPITGRLINNFRNNFERFKDTVARHYAPPFRRYEPSNLFFFLDNEYKETDFTLKKIKEILAGDFLEFPFPLNTPRHYLRSKFYWKNVYHEMASMMMGHQSSGKEWLAKFSMVDYGETSDMYKDFVSREIQDLQFEDIVYMPRLK